LADGGAQGQTRKKAGEECDPAGHENEDLIVFEGISQAA